MGHRQCMINHKKYNYVRPHNQSYKPPIPIKKEELSKYSAKLCIGSVSFAKMCRTIDQLQSTYGLPPSSRLNFREDLIVPEFAVMWENVYHFQHNILQDYSDTTKAIKSNKKSEKKYHHTSIILESRPPIEKLCH